jgi:spermidine synthase
MEISMLAHAQAQLGDKAAQESREALRVYSDVEASALLAIDAASRRDADGAVAACIATFESLRQEPWSRAEFVPQTFDLAISIAEAVPNHRQALFDALREPFPVQTYEGRRTITRYILAEWLGPEAIVEALAPLEPNIPWKAYVLQNRLQAYRATKSPLADQAQSDLEWFREHEQSR